MKVRVYIALHLVLLMALQPVLPYIEYAAFNKYIVEELCVNRDVPDSCCKGKCYLEKRLKETTSPSETSEKAPVAIKLEMKAFVIPHTNKNIFSCIELLINSGEPDIKYYYLQDKSVFHPPSFI